MRKLKANERRVNLKLRRYFKNVVNTSSTFSARENSIHISLSFLCTRNDARIVLVYVARDERRYAYTRKRNCSPRCNTAIRKCDAFCKACVNSIDIARSVRVRACHMSHPEMRCSALGERWRTVFGNACSSFCRTMSITLSIFDHDVRLFERVYVGGRRERFFSLHWRATTVFTEGRGIIIEIVLETSRSWSCGWGLV